MAMLVERRVYVQFLLLCWMMLFCIPFIFFCSWMMSDLTCTESRSQTSIGEKVNRAVLGVVNSGIDGYCSGIDGFLRD